MMLKSVIAFLLTIALSGILPCGAVASPVVVQETKDAAAPPSAPPGALALWYRQPAARWLEALPVGNGRVGAMVFGGVREERLALSESTFWSGAASDQHENPQAREAFAKIRELFKAGKHREAQPLIRSMLGRKRNYGTNLPAGELLLAQSGTEGEVRDYLRELDLDEAVATVAFTVNGVRFRREIVASHPDGIVAVRLTADRPGAIGFTLRYRGGAHPWTVATRGKDTLEISGRAFEKRHSNGQCGVAFQARCRVMAVGGEVSAEPDAVRVVGADAVTVLVALNTDYQGRDPAALGARQIDAADRIEWGQLRARHVADYQRLFRRVTLDLGGVSAAAQPTDVRLETLRKGGADPQLFALFFQYGRYLVIAGSREDSPLPMHLQGIWNDGLAAGMGWTCDYHFDINTQQNYWPTEVTNLSECGQPLFRLVASLQEPGRRTARNTYGIDRGWVCHVVTNAWGYTDPGWAEGWGLHVVGGVEGPG
ncbi:MAG: glycoside hydrolase family 95 protein [Verrucomicrobia bacterium]|nr:glycoside hydrolase family 95 protein [Verrucomicrobiota bacterium]